MPTARVCDTTMENTRENTSMNLNLSHRDSLNTASRPHTVFSEARRDNQDSYRSVNFTYNEANKSEPMLVEDQSTSA